MAKDHIVDYDTTAANNTDVDGVNVNEGCAPSGINDAIREQMADLAEFYGDIGGSLVSAGSQGAFTLTTNDNVAAYAQKQFYTFEANHAMPDTATATLNVNAIGAKAIRKHVDVNLDQNDIKANQMVMVAYEAATDVFHLLTPVGKEAGKVIQVVEASYTTYSSHSTQIPTDDTIPQNTEGEEIVTAAITPTAAANRLRIEIDFPTVSVGSANFTTTLALFQDATANALAASGFTQATANGFMSMRLTHEMQAATTSSTTFKARIGPNTASSVYMNGSPSARIYGGVSAARMRIFEIAN